MARYGSCRGRILLKAFKGNCQLYSAYGGSEKDAVVPNAKSARI
jgi:hypothetical protein